MKGDVAQVRFRNTTSNEQMASSGLLIVEKERQEAVERAMAAYRARQARPRTTTRGGAGLGHGARRISRKEAIAKIAKTHPRSAWKLPNGYFGGRQVGGGH